MKRVITINLNDDVCAFLDKTSTNRSGYINQLLMQEMEKNGINPKGDEMANIKTRNLYEILKIIQEKRYVDITALRPILEIELGVTEKTIDRYITLLETARKIKKNGKYVLDLGYVQECRNKNIPIPGDEKWYSEKAETNRDLTEKEKEMVELTDDEEKVRGGD